MQPKKTSVKSRKLRVVIQAIFYVILGCLLGVVFYLNWICGIIGLVITSLILLFNNYVLTYFEPKDKSECTVSKSTKLNATFSSTLQYLMKTDHLKNYRPQILVLTGNPAARPSLVDFASNLTNGRSLLLCGYILNEKLTDRIFAKEERIDRHFKHWMRKREVQGELVSVASESMEQGVSIFLQTVGIGVLKPNILLIGFKTNWHKMDVSILQDYYRTIEIAFAKNVTLLIFRNSTGLDFTESLQKFHMSQKDLDVEKIVKSESSDNEEFQVEDETHNHEIKKLGSRKAISSVQQALNKKKIHSAQEIEKNNSSRENVNDSRFKYSIHNPEQQQFMVSLTKFQTPVKNGVIDVYWMNDNGGAALLIPYLLTQQGSYLHGAKIRVFVKPKQMSSELQTMMIKLKNFGLDSEHLTVLDTLNEPPKSDSNQFFVAKLQNFIARPYGQKANGLTSMNEIEKVSSKTAKIMRLGEVMREHSQDSDLVIVTLPATRSEEVSASIFVGWLDALTHALPPTLLIKGNNVSTLTYLNEET